ncbi:MAG: hypothetical protein A2418_00605 [Candidatus Brennerbacteria bacterium RIFOXYC1_FULL_41_11]|uniref:Class I SAM-dependent methyltransferase n=1 Tax=Candidatus Brennerbacteria bacterium RIFOXYD1_FULL_41_16 TaxID=1797529 RepID=A0A1G1XL31_9BACT|nr:MAG: hypothetical protein UU61_C0034G0004 [Parcubacteria group bacterium GW2011_GWB1_41_4]OGY39765.1 MAG: hypothetical protein A2391_03505 [Candidatus Brennerbacteria bacterium RIFOXYB1_FULL_41_13]OGY40383.1 MAG: hypothetical protein A2418_00605 [Candidatus Brennerbacteria bacterium RIFOXYC1_FULL_41_11]OGY40813.1 MAG: hypothetical protein A2570_00140 [Candidatus Brennerbacteria bacterium RIFOXYD1_FULL_41_16]
MFKDYLKQTRAYPLLRLLKSYFEAVLWFFGSKQGVSPPALFKRAVIKQYAKKFSPSIFIETGTYLGDTVAAVKNLFSEIHSIELGENLAKEARKRFAKYSHIKIHQGDSAIVLPEIFKNASKKPTLFWLDAHYSEGITVGSDDNLPLVKEIKTILEHWQSGSVVLIDDARLMGRQKGYPGFEEIKNLVEKYNLGLKVGQELDIIRIYTPTL